MRNGTEFHTMIHQSFEPPHDKTNKMTVHPAKTQISLGIRPVWSESSLSAWRKLGSLATHWAYSEDWSDWADAQADLSLRWVHTHFVGFVTRWLICAWQGFGRSLTLWALRSWQEIKSPADFMTLHTQCSSKMDLHKPNYAWWSPQL